MKERIIILFTLLFALQNIFAQKEANIWYFGEYAGIDFNFNPPVALTNSAMSQYEGCATISDGGGNLLFYTDGMTVWNKHHQIMPNGTGLMGNPTSTQSGVIVPEPGNGNIYFVFTVGAEVSSDGVRYSVVDLNLDNGNGDVTSEKNIFLTAPSEEKITAVRHNNGVDVWVITHLWNSKRFEAYLVTKQGVNVSPVISDVGTYHSGPDVHGSMKVSPDGKKLAIVTRFIKSFELFDFNAETGEVSNPVAFPPFSGPGTLYGIAFSEDCSKLYVDQYGSGSNIFQYDLNAGDSISIINSKTFVGSVDNIHIGAMQLAPDKKIYVSKHNNLVGDDYLGVINSPNKKGVDCDFVEDGFFLEGKKCIWGLPNFIQSYFIETMDFAWQPGCYGDTTVFFPDIGQVDSIQWNFDDPASGMENHSTALNPGHVFTSTGTFDVVLTVWIGGTSKMLTKQVTITETVLVSLGTDTTFCNGNTLLLSPGSNYFHYLWQDGSTDSLLVASDAGTYWVQVTDSSGCKASDSINIDTFPGFDFSIGNDTTICFGDYVFLYAPDGFESYQWQDGSDNTSYIADTSGYYWLQVTDTNNCVARDSMLLTANKVPADILGNDTLFCKDGTFTLRTNPVYEQYFWNNGSNDSVLTASQPGKYWVTVFDTLGCSGSDTIQLDYFPSITLELNATGQLCEDDSLILQAISNYNNYLWQDSSQNQTYIAKDSGIYWVKVISPCETKSDSITIDACSSIWIPNVFTPNNDGYNDNFGAVAKNIVKFKLVIFNRWGQELKTLHNINEKWDGTYRGQKAAQGTYFWVADYEQVERDGSMKHVRLQGSVTLIR